MMKEGEDLSASNELAIKMHRITKTFGKVIANKDVDLELREGEILALLGENGSGKTTLMNMLSGIYFPDHGEIYVHGKPVTIRSPKNAFSLGIGMIHQHFRLVDVLTAAENIVLGLDGGLTVNRKEINRKVEELAKRYGFDLDPSKKVYNMAVSEKQTVEILKALSEDSSLIIMDEPTASLSSKESEALFGIINQLREKGVSILYISHRLEEVFRLADRLTVLRDGRKVAVLEKDQINPPDVIKMMIGKELSEATASRCLHRSKMEPVLEVRSLSRKGTFSDISFTLHRGEILGIGGLVGAGRTEVLRCIFGADSYDGGEILFQGKKLPCRVSETIARGFGLVPEDRRNQGFIPLLSIERNIAVPNYDFLSKASNVNRAEEKKLGIDAVGKLDIRPADSQLPVGNLSGGNQQKVVIGKWLARDLRVLLIDEPTAGIDIGAKDEIYKILDNLAEQGVSILLVSSDLQELLRVSHRILVFRKGHIQKEFDSGVITQEDVLMAASGIDTAKKEEKNT